MKKLFVRYYKSKNLGDALNKDLIKIISGVNRIIYYDKRKFYFKLRKFFGLYPKQNYLVIGSMLKWADKNTIVWGTGFISADSKLSVKPKKICAVRVL